MNQLKTNLIINQSSGRIESTGSVSRSIPFSNPAAAARARKALGELGKLTKERRKEIQDEKFLPFGEQDVDEWLICDFLIFDFLI